MADLPSVDSFFGRPAQPQGKPSVDEFFGPAQDHPVKSSAAIDQAMSQDTLGGPLNAIGHVLNAFGQGAKEGWGTAKVGELAPETTDFMKKMGWFNDYKDGQSSLVKGINEAIIRPAAGTLSTAMRGFSAAFSGAEQAAAQAGQEVGMPEVGRTAAEIIEATGSGALHGVAGIPHAAEPVDLGRARSLRIIGDGEEGWSGTKVVEPATEAQKAEAMQPQVSAIQEQEPPAGAPETPTAAEVEPGVTPEPPKPQDIHDVARTIDPVTFDHYDALSSRVDTFRRWITELDQTRREQAETNAPHTAEINDLKSRLADEDATPRLRKKYEARLGDLQTENDAAIAEATKGDSPDMARVRGELQKADYAMRDLAPNVANAYRQAREIVPEELPAEAPVEQSVADQPMAQGEPTQPATESPAAPVAAQAPQVSSTEAKTAPVNENTVQDIAGDVTNKLIAAGRPEEEAKAAAAIIQAHYETRAQRFGGTKGTAQELYSKEAPEIREGGVGGRRGAAAGKASIRDGRTIITLFQKADASTFMHETAHNWLEELGRDARDAAATPEIKADMKAVHDWLGVKEGEEIATRQHEKFARGFERYLMEGVAPSQKLADVFAQFKDWLTKIYQVVQRLRSPITDDIRDVYARLIEANPEKPVIGAERPVEHTMADIHERDAEATQPEKASEAADNIRKEIDAIAREKAPEIHDELNPQPEAGGIAPENEVASGGGNAPGPAAGDNGTAAESGTLTASRNEVAPEGSAVRREPTAEPAGPNAQFGRSDDGLVDKAGNIRLDNLNTPEDVSQVIRESADTGNDFMAARRGNISDIQVLDLADALGMDAESLNLRKLGQAFNAEQIVAARKLLIQSATTVRDAMSKAGRLEATDQEVMAYAEVKARHMMIQEQVAGITAEAGRALRAFRSLEGQQEAVQIGQFIEQTQGKTLFQLREEAKKGAQLETPQQLSKFLNDSRKPTFKDMLLEYWINALLSGPLTHMKNIMGNSLVATNSVIETALASGVGKILGSEEAVQMGEAKARWFGLTQGAIEGFQSAKAIVKSEEAIEGSHTVEVQRQAIPGVTGQVIRVPTRLLSAEDEVFKAIGFRQELNALAHRQATKEGLTGDAFVSRMTDLVSNPSEEAMLQAKSNAEYQTFTNPLGPTGKAIQTFANSHPLAKFIVPFLRTPINIVKYAGERTPLGLISREIRENLSGKNGTIARDTQIARLGLGTSLAAATVGLAAQGLITGGGPSDNAQKALMRAAGWQPYSIKIGEMYYSYQWAEPLATITGTVADIADIIHGSEAKGDDYDKVIGGLIGGISQNILGKLSLRGVSDFIQAAVDPTRYGGGYIQSFVGSFVPAIVAQAERTVDPTLRQARTTVDMLKSRVPGLSETLLPKRDVWGEPIVNQGSLGPDIANPIYESKMRNDPVDRTLLNLGYYPTALKRSIRGVQLTDQQFDDYSRMAGRMAKMRLDAIVRTPGFSDTPPAIQAEIVAKTVDSSRETARSVVMMTNPQIIRDAIAAKTSKLQRPQSVGAL